MDLNLNDQGLLENPRDIQAWLEEMGVEHYTLRYDEQRDGLVVDVKWSVYFEGKLGALTQLPVQFGKVAGSFNCAHNQLTSLVGAPQAVRHSFYCYQNKITSLTGAPHSVPGDFYCDNNLLTSLAGTLQAVGRDFSCEHNNLTSLTGDLLIVGGYFNCSNNHLTSVAGAPLVGEYSSFPHHLTIQGIGEIDSYGNLVVSPKNYHAYLAAVQQLLVQQAGQDLFY